MNCAGNLLIVRHFLHLWRVYSKASYLYEVNWNAEGPMCPRKIGHGE